MDSFYSRARRWITTGEYDSDDIDNTIRALTLRATGQRGISDAVKDDLWRAIKMLRAHTADGECLQEEGSELSPGLAAAQASVGSVLDSGPLAADPCDCIVLHGAEKARRFVELRRRLNSQ